MDEEKDTVLKHYGTPRHSGRYPWGSGKKYQRSRNFISQYEELRKKGLSQKEIAKGLGLKSTSELNAKRAQALEEKNQSDMLFVSKLHAKGMSNIAIAERCNKTEGWVRQMLKKDANEAAKKKSITNIAKGLGEQIREKGYVDIGKATNLYLGITETKLKAAISALEMQGYQMLYPQIQQLGTDHSTNFKVMIPPGKDRTEAYREINANPKVIQTFKEVKFEDQGFGPMKVIHDPVNIKSDRIQVRYAEDGGKNMDGVIEIRPGVKELDMGGKTYAQVRIGVDGTHYLKGMAVYGDPKKMPNGVDIIFNTNKTKDVPKLAVFKKQDLNDTHNPFGSSIDDQNDWYDADGKKHEGALNIVRQEGQWDHWSKNLPSQFLSKQPRELAQRQLDIAAEQKENEFELINSLTNATLKKELLKSFGDECDAAAVALKGAALPRQATKVILPLPSLSDKEVYAPDFDNGEEVVLVRFPHGGLFEIPRLKVNNNNREGKQRLTSHPEDAIGINPKVAEQLSGADFDGDTVLIIPTKGQKINAGKPEPDLINYDPKEKYARPAGTTSPWKKGSETEKVQMGMISNLITDMTLNDAPMSDIIRAVKHSMTIIDTGKHNLDYKASYEDNGIAALKEKYRGNKRAGASTLISLASSEAHPTQRDRNNPYNIDKETGKKVFNYKPEFWFPKGTPKEERDYNKLKEAKELYKKGVPIQEIEKKLGVENKTMTTTKMYETDDAFSLSTGLPIETIYAEYANRMKRLGDKARKISANTVEKDYNESAAQVYAKEVQSIQEKITKTDKNRPIERQAVAISNSMLALKKQAKPDMTKDELKKAKNQCLREARRQTGAQKYKATLTDKEWEAIQAGALRKTTLKKLLLAVDNEQIIKRALPQESKGLSPSITSRARTMLRNGYSYSEVSEALNVSVSTLKKNLNES